MKKIPCLYAIVRFCPFVETEEFANVGIVIISPEHRIFHFKLMTKKHARVTDFFEQLDAPVFKAAMQNLKEEFDRIHRLLQQHGFDKRLKHNDADFARTLFNEIVRPREAVIKFSDIRGVLLTDAKTKLEELYGYYVERDFVTPLYREQVLERTLRKWFQEAGVSGRFERLEVGNDEYHATFPFAEERNGAVITAIKPLNLGQDQPSKILDHGGAWIWKLAQLKRKKTLPDRVLVTVEGPGELATPATGKAFRDVVNELKGVGAEVLTYERKVEIISFVTH
jgi:hypothetical protein